MKMLVAGIGNIFFGDDGFGVEVANRLGKDAPPGVTFTEFGIRGLHLAYELLEGYDTLVLVDALPMGEVPGTVAIIEVDLEDADVGQSMVDPTMDAHSMSPATVLGLLGGLGGKLGRVLVVGCEPSDIAPAIGLSSEVEAAVPAAVEAVRSLVADLCLQAGASA